ncbi:hypothetical protein NDU88_003672 [Pleurodeles waltl]|uniref:Uncharacterized protein n=1 Tax=Pleurodeles waltl TaxID=8319 RepID=A0AAV7T5M2_PLEWA|nr:hypothetical protein NDU88_003672 [Pleurodeles waltl]
MPGCHGDRSVLQRQLREASKREALILVIEINSTSINFGLTWLYYYNKLKPGQSFQWNVEELPENGLLQRFAVLKHLLRHRNLHLFPPTKDLEQLQQIEVFVLSSQKVRYKSSTRCSMPGTVLNSSEP